MELKHKFIPIVFLLSALCLVSFVSSTDILEFRNPTVDEILTGTTQQLNMTIDASTITWNVTWAYNQSSATLTNIEVVSNTSPSQDNYNASWDTTALEDDVNYCLNITSRNVSNTVISSNLTCGLWIDNGNPTSSFNSSMFSNNLALVLDTTFNVAISADDTLGLDNCTVYFTETTSPFTVSSQAVTAGGNACILTTDAETQSLNANMNYDIVMEAHDANNNKTNSTSRTLIVTVTSAGGGGGSSVTTTDDGLTLPGAGAVSGIGESIANFFRGIADFFKGLFGGN